MNQDELKKIIESSDQYDQDRQDGLRGMIGEFYTRKMLPIVVLVWGFGITCMAGAVVSAVMFFATEQVQYQIMWAVIFLTCIQWVGLMKIFAWQMIHRNSIKREIKRLELRIVDVAGRIGGEPQGQ
jgi:hypothetical protein